ncbi:DUF397 domain-containing protein [Streptomyces sp. GLT-R25]
MKRSEHTIPDASVLPAWRKSSHSGGESGQCLEVHRPRLVRGLAQVQLQRRKRR